MFADPDIDAVSVVHDVGPASESAMAALEAGKHVFLEKPIARTVPDAGEDHRGVEGGEGHPDIGHVCRFNPRYRTAKEAIEAGRIGKIVSLSSRRNIPAAWTPTILNKIGPIVGMQSMTPI